MISDLLNDDKKEDKVKEQLELMMKLADSRLDTFESELKTMFLDQESAAKTSIPGRRALRFERHVQVDAERTVSLLSVRGFFCFVFFCLPVWRYLSAS